MRRHLNGSLRGQMLEEKDRIEQLLRERTLDLPRAGSVVQRVGVELETALINPQGYPDLSGDNILAKVNQRWLTSEFPLFVREIVTDAIMAGPDMISQLFLQLIERRAVLARAAGEHGAKLVDIGLLASFPESGLARGTEFVSGATRYRSLLQYLGTRNGRYRFDLHCPGGIRTIDVASSPLPAAPTAGCSPNVQFRHDVIGLAADLTTAISWVFPLLSSSSPLAVEDRCEWDSRIPFWQYGMDPKRELSPFGRGRYWNRRGAEVLMDWFDYVLDGELILDFEEAGMDPHGSGFPALSLVAGTRWIQTGRLRASLVEERLCPYFELRLPDVGLTVTDNIADMIFYLGLITHLIKEVESAESIMSAPEAEQTFMASQRFGEVTVPWRGRNVDGRTLILQLLPDVRAALVEEGFPAEIVDRLLAVIERRISRKQTAAEWILKQLEWRELECSRPEAIRRILVDIANRQIEQSTSLDDPVGVGDW